MSIACDWFPMEHDEIVVWVKAHEEVLSANLVAISTFPMPFRKVIVGLMSSENRIALWREHKTTVAESDASLNDEQSPSSSSALRYCPGQSAQVRIFETLGPPEPAGGLPLPPDATPRAPA